MIGLHLLQYEVLILMPGYRSFRHADLLLAGQLLYRLLLGATLLNIFSKCDALADQFELISQL